MSTEAGPKFARTPHELTALARGIFDRLWRNASFRQGSLSIEDEPKSVAIGHGLRDHLLFSFIAISGFAVVAAVVGNYAFYAISESLHQLTDRSVLPDKGPVHPARPATAPDTIRCWAARRGLPFRPYGPFEADRQNAARTR